MRVFAHPQQRDLQLPSLIEAQVVADPCRSQPAANVGEVLLAERCELTDSELERHILDCGGQMLLAMSRWERYGDFQDRGEAARWELLQRDAIARRSPEQVKRMEAARGLG